MKNLKVLMIGPGTPDKLSSGLGIVAEELRKVLANKLHLVSVEPGEITPRTKEEATAGFSDKAVVRDIIRVPVAVTQTIDAYSYTEPGSEADSIALTSALKQHYHKYSESVVKSSLGYDFDLIYVHDWIGMEAAMLLQEETARPMVLHIHSLDTDRLGVNHKSWVYDIEASAIAKADAIIAVSQYTREKIINDYFGDPAKITVVHPALPTYEKVKSRQPLDQTVLFLGRFASQKRPLKFIDIAEKVIKKNKDVHFLMVGDGDLKDEVIEKVAQKSLGGNVHFADQIEHQDVGKVFAKTSILCITSDSEPFGLTALEAAEAGIPVILARQSGAREVLTGALTVDKDDVNGYARRILKLLDDEVARKKAIEKNQADVARLNWQATAEKIIEVFRNVVK